MPSYPIEIKLKKKPVQARSKLTFDAIIQASAWVLVHEGYEAATTNRIAEKAGVNIASLYEYFPNKESIIAVLAERELSSYVRATGEQISQVRPQSEAAIVAHMIRWGVNYIVKQRGLLSTLILEVPFVHTLSSVQQTMASAVSIVQTSMRGDDRLRLHSLEVDAWLLIRMCFNTALEIASNKIDDERREVLLTGLILFTYRMLFARDPASAELDVMGLGRLNMPPQTA